MALTGQLRTERGEREREAPCDTPAEGGSVEQPTANSSHEEAESACDGGRYYGRRGRGGGSGLISSRGGPGALGRGGASKENIARWRRGAALARTFKPVVQWRPELSNPDCFNFQERRRRRSANNACHPSLAPSFHPSRDGAPPSHATLCSKHTTISLPPAAAYPTVAHQRRPMAGSRRCLNNRSSSRTCPKRCRYVVWETAVAHLHAL